MSRTFNTDPLPIKAARYQVPVKALEGEEGQGVHYDRAVRNTEPHRGTDAEHIWEDIHQGKDVDCFPIDTYLNDPRLRKDFYPGIKDVDEDCHRRTRARERVANQELVKDANTPGSELDNY